MAVRPIPEGYHTVTPYFTVRDLAKFIQFVQKAFDATVVHQMPNPAGGIMHAEFKIGDSMLMGGEFNEKYPPTPLSLYLYVPDTDAVYRKAIAAGATSIMEPANQFYGDRNGGVKDAWGNSWWIGTHVEDVPPEELKNAQRPWASDQ